MLSQAHLLPDAHPQLYFWPQTTITLSKTLRSAAHFPLTSHNSVSPKLQGGKLQGGVSRKPHVAPSFAQHEKTSSA